MGQTLETYLLGASGSQTMAIGVASSQDNVLLTIAGDDGMPLVRSHVGHLTSWGSVLSATQDYFFTLSVEQPISNNEPYVSQVSITG